MSKCTEVGSDDYVNLKYNCKLMLMFSTTFNEYLNHIFQIKRLEIKSFYYT